MTSEAAAKGPITREVIEESAGDYAEAVAWLRKSLNSQRDDMRANRDRAAKWAFRSQVTIILFGFVASLAAIFSKGWQGEEYWSLLNIVTPLLISALTAVVTLFDFRGAFARNSSAYSAISAIKSEIDYRLLLGLKDAKARITLDMLDAWDKRTDAAVSQHVQSWERSMTDKKAKD